MHSSLKLIARNSGPDFSMETLLRELLFDTGDSILFVDLSFKVRGSQLQRQPKFIDCRMSGSSAAIACR